MVDSTMIRLRILEAVRSKLKKENFRSQKIIKNILLSFTIKGGSFIIGLLLVPMVISYIDPVQYGVWLTISSVVSWISFFDIGLGNGLRNNLTVAISLKEYEKAKIYVSTAYVSITGISLLFFLSFCFINPFIKWNTIFNLPASIRDIHLILLIVFGTFCVQFVFQLINVVLTSIHEPATVGLISFFGQLSLLIVIFIVKQFMPGDLLLLVPILTGVPLTVLVISSFILYKTKLKRIAPLLRCFDFTYIKRILNIGSIFFLIQIGALVLFQTDNIIISRVMGPEAVTSFHVTYKLFSVIIMIFTIIITPYWSSFTDAYAKNDISWIKKNIKVIQKLWLLLTLGTLILLFLSPWIFDIWLGQRVKVSFILSLAMAVYVVVYMWQTIHVYLLNGIGKIKLQLILVTISAILNIPLAVMLGKRFGVAGIITANTLMFSIMGILFSIQVEKILTQKASGLWGR